MKRLFGGILLAVGILIMTCSGLCSAWIVIMGIGSIAQLGPSALTFLIVPAIIGGVPFAAGFGLFYWGRSLMREAQEVMDDELRDRFE